MSILGLLIQCLIGYLFIDQIPKWLHVGGTIALILRLIGVVIIIRAVIHFII